MEPEELSPALLQPQVTVVATLGELLATLPRRHEEMLLLLESAGRLYWDLECFTNDLWITLYFTEGTWLRRNVTYDDDDPLTSMSKALAAYDGTTWTERDDVTMVARMWQRLASVFLNSWAEQAWKATKLRSICRVTVTEVTHKVATATAWARELQDEAARAGTAQANMVGLLERLVAACDEATAFPRELQRRVGDIVAALEGTNEASPDVPEALLAKVAEAERLWEANFRLAKDHLRGTVEATMFWFTGDPTSLSGVAERCQRATEDIPRLLRPPERPQSVPRVSSVTMEPQKVSSPQLQVLVAVVATLGEVVATVKGLQWGKFLHSLHEDLKNFIRSLRAFLKHSGVTSVGNSDVPSLRRALTTIWATPGTTWANLRAAASTWRELVAKLVDSWDWLVREATKLREKGVTAQQLMVALDKKEGVWVMDLHGAQVVGATRRGHWPVVALGPLQRLVAVCVRATLFYWNMEWQLRDIKAILKGTNEVSPDVLQALMAKVVKFEWLWDASTRLAKEHLLGTLGVIGNLLWNPCGDHGGPGGPGSRAVAQRCQKAIEDIPRLLQESFT